MKGDGRDWLATLALPQTAREQLTVSLAMIDALDAQLEPLVESCVPTHGGSQAAKR